MGHIRVGRLPKTKKWTQVVEAIKADERHLSRIANATIEATGRDISSLSNEPSVYYPFFILSQIISKVDSENFVEALSELGIASRKISSTLEFINQTSEFIQKKIRKDGNPKELISEVALNSFTEVLTRVSIGETQSIFGSSFEDVRKTIRKYKSPEGFAELARIYFSSFLNRFLQYYLSRETSNLISPKHGFQNIGHLNSFDESIKTYSFQSSKVIEDFAGGWFSKKKWLGELNENEIKSFLYVAFKKLKAELDLEVSR